MPRTSKPLTDTEIRKAPSKDKEYTLWDGQGLNLRIKPNGSKTWIFRYQRPYTKKRANLSIGNYPSVSLAIARSARQNYLSLLSQDIDPGEHKAERLRQEIETHESTLKKVALKWFEIKKGKVSEGYADDIWRSLEAYIFPELGALPVSRIKAPQVINILQPIAARSALETVKRLCQRLNEVMVFAVNTGLIDANPLSDINKAFKAPSKSNMATIKPDDLPELMQAIARASIKLTTRSLLEWQLHTMVRPSEAAGTRWEEIDFINKTWTIPSERMKKKRPHVVPLTTQAVTLLEVMKPVSGHREHVFPADRKPSTHINSQTANMAIKRMGFGGRLVAHGLRSIASTALNEQGFDPDIVESALAHSDNNGVRAAYNRAEYLNRRREMMNWWSNYIQHSAEGNLSLSAAPS